MSYISKTSLWKITKDLAWSTYQVLTQDLARSIVKDLIWSTHQVLTQDLVHHKDRSSMWSSMIPGADPAKFKGRGPHWGDQNQSQKESGQKKYLSKKTEGWGGGLFPLQTLQRYYFTVSYSKLQNKHPFILSFFICLYIYYNIYKIKKDPKYPTFIHFFFNTYEKSGGRTPSPPIHQVAKQDLTHQVFPKELARSIMVDLHARSRRI